MSSRQQSAKAAKKAKNRSGGSGAGTSASRRPPTSATRTGARRAKPSGRTTAPKPEPSTKGRSAIADAKEFAYRPYANRMAAMGAKPDGSKMSGKEYRKASKERQRAAMMIPGAPAVVRGGFPGFLILVFGELLTLPVRGNGLVLYWVALIGYAVAGNRAATPSGTDTKRATRDGALAGAFAFALTIPLRFTADSHNTFLRPWALALQIIVGLVVGGLAALIASRARRKTAATTEG